MKYLAGLALALCLALPALAGPLPAPPGGSLYHGVFPGGYSGEENDIAPAQVASYEASVGRRVAWVMFSHNWYQGHAFPAETARWIGARGAVPWIRLMMRSDADLNHREHRYSLAAIARGDFDADLSAWGRAAARQGPLIVEFGTEMNGDWFSWNARWNGRAKGPARFRAAFRRIVALTRAAGATNITWVFHANGGDQPDRNWNRMEAYYPGDDVVDWLALSVYGMQAPDDRDRTDFRASMDQTIARLARMAPGKPVVLAEFATDVNNPREAAAAWADAALADMLSGRWPSLIGFSWWNETWQNDGKQAHDTDLRVESDADLARIFHSRLNGPRIVDRFR